MKSRGRIVVSILITAITAITFVLGSMMYYSNLKKTRQNIIGVELADFIYNVKYSMQFGKQIETFYGMDEMLRDEKELFETFEDLYVLSDNNAVIFKTSSETPGTQFCSIDAGENKAMGDSLYCMYELSDNVRIMVKTNQHDIVDQTMDYVRSNGLKAGIGLVLVLLLIILFSVSVEEDKTTSFFSAVFLISWIVSFGAMIGFNGYTSYKDSLNTVNDSIQLSIKSDFDKMEKLGVPKEEIYDVDNYLKRYSDMISEVDDIQIDGDDIICVSSDSYVQKMLMDYVFQTTLLLTFSMLIYTEFQIYSKNNRRKDKAVRDGTN